MSDVSTMGGDLIELYKVLNGRYDSDMKPLLALKGELEIRQTRGNSKNVYKERCNKEIRRKFFRNRTIPF